MGKRKVNGSSQQRRQQNDLKSDGDNNNDTHAISPSDGYPIKKANIKSIILAHKADKQNKLQRIKWINRLLVMSLFSLVWIVGVKMLGGGSILSGQMIGTSVVAQHKDSPLLSSSILHQQEHADLNDGNDYGRLNATFINENEDKSKSLIHINKNRHGGKLIKIAQNLLQLLLINPTSMLRKKFRNLFIRLTRTGGQIRL